MVNTKHLSGISLQDTKQSPHSHNHNSLFFSELKPAYTFTLWICICPQKPSTKLGPPPTLDAGLGGTVCPATSLHPGQSDSIPSIPCSMWPSAVFWVLLCKSCVISLYSRLLSLLRRWPQSIHAWNVRAQGLQSQTKENRLAECFFPVDSGDRESAPSHFSGIASR